MAETRDVAQHVDAPELLHDGLDRLGDGRDVEQVAGERFGRALGRLDLFDGLAQPFGIDVDARDARAFGREPKCGRLADARGGARDDRDLLLES